MGMPSSTQPRVRYSQNARPAKPQSRYRRLVAADLARICEIDRSERIETLYVQHGTELEERAGDWSAPAWSAEGEGEYSVAHQRAGCERQLAAGGCALGAFAADQLVGIGIVTPHVGPGIAQLAYLYVSNGYRASGIGVRLSNELERIAHESGTRRSSSRLRRRSTPSASISVGGSCRRRLRYPSCTSSSRTTCTCTNGCRSAALKRV